MKNYKITYWNANNDIVDTHAESTIAAIDLYNDNECTWWHCGDCYTHGRWWAIFSETQLDVILGAFHRTLGMVSDPIDVKRRIECIKLYRGKTCCGLLEAKDYVDMKMGMSMVDIIERLKAREYTDETLQLSVAEFGFPSKCSMLHSQMQNIAACTSKEAACFWLSSDWTNLDNSVTNVIHKRVSSLSEFEAEGFIGDDALFDAILEVVQDER